jgi:hypothetical protein
VYRLITYPGFESPSLRQNIKTTGPSRPVFVSTLTSNTTKGVGAFLGKICMPAAEELGLLLQGKVKSWRATNAVAFLEKARSRLEHQGMVDEVHAHPRLVGKIIENSSWVDESNLQDMWAGLFASSCTPSGTDESSLIFINILEQLTSGEAKLIEFACKDVQIDGDPSGGLLLNTGTVLVPVEGLQKVTGISGLSEIDIALDHLRQMGLFELGSGINPNSTPFVASITATALGLNFFARTQAFVGDPYHFYLKRDV